MEQTEEHTQASGWTAPSTVSLRRFRGEQGAHAHGYTQVLFGLHGAMEVQAGQRSWRIDASCGLVIPPGLAHGLAVCSATDAAQVLVVDGVPLAGQPERLRGFALPHGWAALQRQRWAAACGLHQPGLPLSVQALPGPADDLLQVAHAAPRVLARRRLDAAAVHAAVKGRWHEDWPNARLAAQVALSVAQFSLRWRDLTGLSPQAWLRQQRLDEAVRRLRQGQWLDAVAPAVGYATGTALATALRRERGLRVRNLR
jgi:AraC-like DNA-binding protein